MTDLPLPIPKRCNRVLSIPRNPEYPYLVEKMLTWSVKHPEKAIPSEFHITDLTRFSNFGGRVGLLEKKGRDRIGPTELLQNTSRYLKKELTMLSSTLAALFLSEIPQLLVVNMFVSLERTTIQCEERNCTISVMSHGRKIPIDPSAILRSGLASIKIEPYKKHALDYFSLLIHWSLSLGLMKRTNDGIVLSTDDFYSLLITKGNERSIKSPDILVARVEMLKRDLLKTVLILTNRHEV